MKFITDLTTDIWLHGDTLVRLTTTTGAKFEGLLGRGKTDRIVSLTEEDDDEPYLYMALENVVTIEVL